MLSIIVVLLDALRRALNKSGRGLFMLAGAFAEAMEDWRRTRRKYPFVE
jgi:hypothetical protein